MRKGLAVTLRAAVLALVSNLALAGPLPISLPAMPAAPASPNGAAGGAGHSGIRTAVLEIAIPNSLHHALPRPATAQELDAPAAKVVQWLTGPVPSRCHNGATAASATHACLVI